MGRRAFWGSVCVERRGVRSTILELELGLRSRMEMRFISLVKWIDGVMLD